MNFRFFFYLINIAIVSFSVAGCQYPKISNFKEKAASVINPKKMLTNVENTAQNGSSKNHARPLNEILTGSLADRNGGTTFKAVLSAALDKDPVVISQRRTVKAKLAAINSSQAKKKYQVTSTVYGGIEDITDNTKGIALGLNASRLISDGGKLDAIIAGKNFEAEAAQLNLSATVNERAYSIGVVWLEIEKYKNLKILIDDRIAVLDPLIDQLEQVAKAGIGDVGKVAAAQRTVSGIRVTQTGISEGLAKAQLEYSNAYGYVDKSISYDPQFIRDLLPDTIQDGLAKNSPLLLAMYAKYQASLSRVTAVRADDDFNVGLEARVMRPFAGSGYDSDESVGLVARKTLYNGGMLESDIDEAEAISEATLAEIEAAYRSGTSIIQSAQQSKESMQKAIDLARENAKLTADEIIYLRQQLIIGESSLDSVLSAEARLYEAESQEIKFVTEKHKAELLIASTLGLLAPAIGF